MTRKIIDKEYEFPCVEVKQGFGTFYACAIKARDLLKLCEPIRAKVMEEEYSHEAIDISVSKTAGTQREVHTTRPKQIAEYIKSGSASFPNSIIIGANISENGFLDEPKERKWRYSNGKLIIDKGALTSAVIDGQHRLKGFETLDEEQSELDDELLCSIYLNIPMTYHAQIFSTINSTQRKVNKNLIYQLYQIDMDEKKPEYWSPEVLSVYLSRALGSDDKSPLARRLNLAVASEKEVADGDWKASFSVVVEGVLKYFSSDPKGDRNLFYSRSDKVNEVERVYLKNDASPFRNLYLDGKDKQIYLFFLEYFKVFFDCVEKFDDTAFKSSVGIDAILSSGLEILTFLSKNEFENNLGTSLLAIDYASLPKDKTSSNRSLLRNVIIHSFCKLTGNKYDFHHSVNVEELDKYIINK
ncbi:DGQHR domain-containing protein [Aliivibrio fischeri]|uniref:DGQHR domain-containing protein n=1 Tax=Aliivibrio fischeri TaxID=668 RepID=UPI0012DA229C|nr:DGQHR domain-containing protein [Aliivibrio fischeri]MUK68425.1 DGQHR domain-containing protein [Aliivibrio fischeri]MUK73711.1 DGQHR domain-containing protein [Aliivibrio fischeri]